ncbi:MAG: dUTP diphosphatase [Sphingobacteriales bacterium]|nr:dUTP diphosphatase [Sphingobacteriales bacterium]
MHKTSIAIINRSGNDLPEYATPGASGMDLRASLSSAETFQPMERKLIPTGLFVQIPIGMEGQIRPRSGIALKQGITCLNSPGTIDADYRGEIKVLLINLSTEIQTIAPGERIAQLVFASVLQVTLTAVNELEETLRGAGGFGHTGK